MFCGLEPILLSKRLLVGLSFFKMKVKDENKGVIPEHCVLTSATSRKEKHKINKQHQSITDLTGREDRANDSLWERNKALFILASGNELLHASDVGNERCRATHWWTDKEKWTRTTSYHRKRMLFLHSQIQFNKALFNRRFLSFVINNEFQKDSRKMKEVMALYNL